MQKKRLNKKWEIDIKTGNRFRFGKNWKSFLKRVDSINLKSSKVQLAEWLDNELLGKNFLDIGSGSGLSSLSAFELGAKVYSFDFDEDSVECTKYLKKIKFPKSPKWKIFKGSILDKKFLLKLNKLDKFDIVYSWGVLHHTGSMWEAINNACELVTKKGKLFISIYNDQGEDSLKWQKIKKKYNNLSEPLKSIYLIFQILKMELAFIKEHVIHNKVKEYFLYRLNYSKNYRGMNYFSDVIDWIGGYPFEFAKSNLVIDFVETRGFKTIKTQINNGSGCSQYLFERVN